MSKGPFQAEDCRVVADNLTSMQRSYCMSRIRSVDTSPELAVRRLIHALGYRYRLHDQALPGCPDIVLPRYKKAICVNGCFWHLHACDRGRTIPKHNASYWQAKRHGNAMRDRRNRRRLRYLGWEVLVVWECWTRDTRRLQSKVEAFLSAGQRR